MFFLEGKVSDSLLCLGCWMILFEIILKNFPFFWNFSGLFKRSWMIADSSLINSGNFLTSIIFLSQAKWLFCKKKNKVSLNLEKDTKLFLHLQLISSICKLLILKEDWIMAIFKAILISYKNVYNPGKKDSYPYNLSPM